jgi:hypothetical protein
MSTRYEVPLTAEPQKFSIALAGVNYQMILKWNVSANCWILDIYTEAGISMLTGIPLITGTDLLAQYRYLNFGGSLICESAFDINAVPTFENLGSTSHVYFVVP